MRNTVEVIDPPIERLRRFALDLLFPRWCVRCGDPGEFICVDCRETIVPPPAFRRPPALDDIRCACSYVDAAREAVLALKFGGTTGLVPEIALPMAEALVDWAPSVDAIVPVPLARARHRQRGFNQSDDLARFVGRAAGLPVAPRLLKRIRNTMPQSSLPDQHARWENVRGAFQAVGPVGGNVLIVDDVISTGATVDACATALREVGARRVYALSYAH